MVGEIGSQSIEFKTKQEDSVNLTTSFLDTTGWEFSPDKESAITSLGIQPFRSKVYNEVVIVHPDSPAEKSGVQVGDVLLRAKWCFS